MKPTILLFTSHYLPGEKAGGILRSVANMVDHLQDEFNFKIVTKDRDLTDLKPYENIKKSTWQKVGGAEVFYQKNYSFSEITAIINEIKPELLYLNSFFDVMTIKILLLKKMGKIKVKNVLLAPRGEFTPGCYEPKKLKKDMYVYLSKFFNFYENLYWHSSSKYESKDIKKFFSSGKLKIYEAIDLLRKQNTHHKIEQILHENHLKIIFISRISTEKNLDFALRILSRINFPIIFDIYGPIENVNYYEKCLKIAENLPQNIQWKYRENVPSNEVGTVFSQYDLFLFPTKGENFGHVVGESLSSGTPVLISDQTPWRFAKGEVFGRSIPLDELQTFVEEISFYHKLSSENKQILRKDILLQIPNHIYFKKSIDATRLMLLDIINGKS